MHYEKKDTKERILNESLKLFAQKGYDAVGIKVPSLYKHYKNKRTIFDSIIECVNEVDLGGKKSMKCPSQIWSSLPIVIKLFHLKK